MLSLTHSETVRGTLASVGEHYPKRDIYLKEEKALLLKGAPRSGYRPHKDPCKERLSNISHSSSEIGIDSLGGGELLMSPGAF